jgi:hypothetical protein
VVDFDLKENFKILEKYKSGQYFAGALWKALLTAKSDVDGKFGISF